ncbi:L-rhamnose mutarotase [Sphingobium aromaticiconvertens]|uniref:L-rhamnose mutarotase n=1 Tax=Sphingobium aromaticiconvertens TaxID=365341 RepID=UPI0030164833
MNQVIRRCFVVDLIDDDDMIDRYRAWHRPGGPPQTINDAIRADGVRDLQIWMVGDRMVMIMEQDMAMAADRDGKAARDAANPDVQAWDALMRRFQKSLPFAPDRTWVEMERIYDLGEQP